MAGCSSDAPQSATEMDPFATADCAEADEWVSLFEPQIEWWAGLDERAEGLPDRPTVFVGSSSIRRWEDLARLYSDYSPVQRGFGGGVLAEVARFADELIIRHNPRAVVLFAGANDVAFGTPPETVVERFDCLYTRLRAKLDSTVPILVIGIMPTPSRWGAWDRAVEVNEAIADRAAVTDGLVYIDIPSAFLATGAPPDSDLFVDDELHLNADGYALWDSIVRLAIEANVEPTGAVGDFATLDPGTRVLVDFGDNDADDGTHSGTPDANGQFWNNWVVAPDSSEIVPGDYLDNVMTTSGTATNVDLVISGGFEVHGAGESGLSDPDPDNLGLLAVRAATLDYVSTSSDDATGGFYLRGVDPDARLTMRFFAARFGNDTESTRFTVHGSSTFEATLQTTGPGAGDDSINDNTIVEFPGVQADAWGHVFVDVAIAEGRAAYLSLIELVVE